MTKARKIAWIVVVLIVITGIAGGLWWHIRRSTGPRLLARAELALRAGKFDKALELSGDYVAKYPDDWRGYFTQARALCRQGKYDSARPLLKEASKRKPTEVRIVLTEADTYALPASRVLSAAGEGGNIAPLEEALAKLAKANEILTSFDPNDDAARLDIQQNLGFNHLRMSYVHAAMARMLAKDAEVAEAARDAQGAKKKRDRSEYEGQKAATLQKQALEMLLTLVQRDPSRDRPAEMVVDLCLRTGDRKSLALAREAIGKLDSPPPAAATALAMDELRSSTGQTSADCEKLDGIAVRLDKLRSAHPEDTRVKLARAQAGWMIARARRTTMRPDPNDPNMVLARQLAREVIEAEPRSFRARLLQAQMLLDQEGHAQAERELFTLKTDFPRSPLAQYWYAEAARRTGKVELAREAMRTVTRLIPDHPDARKRFAELLLQGGFYEQAFADAQAYWQGHPGDPEALRLYVRAAQGTDQPDLAREVLGKAWAQLTVGEVLDWPGLCTKLAKEGSARAPSPGKAIWGSLDADARTAVERCAEGTTLEAPRKKVVAELNKLLEKPRLFDAGDFQKVAGVPAEARSFLQADRAALSAKDSRLPNRSLLEAAYPDEIAGKSPVALMAVADGYLALGDAVEAGKVLDDLLATAAKTKPAGTAEVLAVARALMLKERSPEAEKLLNDQLALSPNDPRVCFALASLYNNTARRLQAEELYRRTVLLSDRNPVYRLALARALIDVGELSEAQAVLTPIAASSISAELLQLQIKMLRGEPIDAEAQAILQRPDAGRRFGLSLAMIYLAIGQPKRSAEICLDGLKANPNDVDLRRPLAQAYLAMGRRDEGIAEWKRVIASRPQSLPAYQRLALLLLAKAGLEGLEGEAATRPAQAFVRMSWEEVEKAIQKARSEMAEISRARDDLVDLALAGLYARLGQPDKGAECCERAVRSPASDGATRFRARLLRASLLARGGKLDDALRELDKLVAATEGIAKTRAMYAKANLLAANKQYPKAEAVLITLCEEAQARKDPFALLQAASLLARIEEIDEALSACDTVQQMLPNDPRSYLLRANVLMTAERLDEVPNLYEKAIELQPGDFRLYTALARVFDAQGKPLAALGALNRLQKTGRAGKPIGLFYEGALFARWGLQAEAIQRYEAVADLRYEPSPDLQLALARALARLGRGDQAKAALAKIPEHAREYVSAQLMLADLAEAAEVRLATVRKLGGKRPRSQRVLLHEMSILIGAGKPAEAVQAFEAFRKRMGAAARPPERAAALALTAAIRSGDLSKAGEIAKALAASSPSPRWRVTAALLLPDGGSEAASRPAGPGLPKVSEAGVFPAALLLCRTKRAGDEKTAKQCADRLDSLDAGLGKLQPPRSIPAALRLLCALLTDDEVQIKVAIAKLGSGPDGAAARELVSHSKASPKAAGEVATFVKTFIARELGLPELARIWAMQALRARPASQWAALEVMLTGPGAAELKEAGETLRPKDCELAQVLRADLLARQNHPAQAAEIHGALARRAGKVDPAYLLQQAMALEAAGRLEQALAVYREVMQLAKDKDPAAANNAACLVVQLSPKDAAKLAEARTWADAALKARPLPHIQDTAGWIAHLQGRDADALPLLRRAARGLPGSPDVHYHLGVVEAAAGDEQLAQWHLAAAVDLGEKLQAGGQTLPKTTAEVIRLAKQALAEVKRPG